MLVTALLVPEKSNILRHDVVQMGKNAINTSGFGHGLRRNGRYHSPPLPPHTHNSPPNQPTMVGDLGLRVKNLV